MNQRTQELLKQATDDIMGMPIVNQKKFAELIVRECLDEIQYDDGATHVDELLLKHFGVEE